MLEDKTLTFKRNPCLSKPEMIFLFTLQTKSRHKMKALAFAFFH